MCKRRANHSLLTTVRRLTVAASDLARIALGRLCEVLATQPYCLQPGDDQPLCLLLIVNREDFPNGLSRCTSHQPECLLTKPLRIETPATPQHFGHRSVYRAITAFFNSSFL